MRKLDILFIDSGLSMNNIEKVLSNELNISVFNLSTSIRKEIKNKSNLSTEIRKNLDSGEILTIDLIEKLIIKNLREISGDLILTRYPRTTEQYLELEKVLANENIILNKVWFFKIRNQKEFMTEHFKNPLNKKYLDKFGNEIIDNWIIKFNQQRTEIENIKKVMNKLEWKNIEMDYTLESNTEYIKESIINCA